MKIFIFFLCASVVSACLENEFDFCNSIPTLSELQEEQTRRSYPETFYYALKGIAKCCQEFSCSVRETCMKQLADFELSIKRHTELSIEPDTEVMADYACKCGYTYNRLLDKERRALPTGGDYKPNPLMGCMDNDGLDREFLCAPSLYYIQDLNCCSSPQSCEEDLKLKMAKSVFAHRGDHNSRMLQVMDRVNVSDIKYLSMVTYVNTIETCNTKEQWGRDFRKKQNFPPIPADYNEYLRAVLMKLRKGGGTKGVYDYFKEYIEENANFTMDYRISEKENCFTWDPLFNPLTYEYYGRFISDTLRDCNSQGSSDMECAEKAGVVGSLEPAGGYQYLVRNLLRVKTRTEWECAMNKGNYQLSSQYMYKFSEADRDQLYSAEKPSRLRYLQLTVPSFMGLRSMFWFTQFFSNTLASTACAQGERWGKKIPVYPGATCEKIAEIKYVDDLHIVKDTLDPLIQYAVAKFCCVHASMRTFDWSTNACPTVDFTWKLPVPTSINRLNLIHINTYF